MNLNEIKKMDYKFITNNKYGFTISIPSYFKEEDIDVENVIYTFINQYDENEEITVSIGNDDMPNIFEILYNDDMPDTIEIIDNDKKIQFPEIKYLTISNHLLMYQMYIKEKNKTLLVYNLNGFVITFRHRSGDDDFGILNNILSTIKLFDTECSIEKSKNKKEFNIGTNPFL